MSQNILARYGMGHDPYAWRSDMDAPQNMLGPRATMTQGPAPSGYDRIRDGVYNMLGGKPANAWAADKLATAVDVGTLGMVTGAYDGGAELARGGGPGYLGMALMPGAKVAAPAAKAAGKAATEAVQGMRAYHGSPHDFDKFDLSKIGTGEGAQAYGHGLYFAESEGVARSYRDALSENVNKDAAKANFERIIREIDDLQRTNPSPHRVQLRQEVEASIKALDDIKPSGRMYEVNLKASPDDFLDLDKPLSEQGEKVKAAVNERFKDAAPSFRNSLEGAPMSEVYRLMSPRGSGQGATNQMRAATETLREAGIPGVKYLDQGSRGAGEGSRNYVAFDDSIIEILRKYGLLPPAVAGGATATQDGGEQ